ncbi:cytosol aminopeptidase-like [Daktulosphaira vitifoliae]|uniref:cytosol aminopeptidase-like n=1 Tax=Daktulosphaira vitifoliae TaxID=58002 RepID=UPI0021AA1E29|nr:cytosol aminopeptidase-like [Daktulosphaira vitifoliae]
MLSKFLKNRNLVESCIRYSTGACPPPKKGLVLGVYRECNQNELRLSTQAQNFNDSIQGKAEEFLLTSNIAEQPVVVAHNLHPDYFAVAFAGIGPKDAKFNSQESLEECLEWTRIGAGLGARALHQYGVDQIYVENMSSPDAAAEGSVMGVWEFDAYQTDEESVRSIVLPFNVSDPNLWKYGTITGEATNLARYIAHLPPNEGTPEAIAKFAIDNLCKCQVNVDVRDVEWIEQKKLNSILNVAKGSRRLPLLLELSYCGGVADQKPAVLIGDGCTYDSWGLCLQDNQQVDWGMYGKSGAAAVIAAMKGIAQLSLPLNVNALVPLYENKPGAMALKPGSVIKTFDGNTTEVHSTNVSSRLVLSDLIGYSHTLAPNVIVNISALSNDTRKYMSSGAIFGFTTDDDIYKTFEEAASSTGDRVIRGPLWEFYKAKTTWPTMADTRVVPNQCTGDAMAAAMFLENFKPKGAAMVTLDIGGSAFLRSLKPDHYLRPHRMTGSPMRAVIQFLKQIACPNDRRLRC